MYHKKNRGKDGGLLKTANSSVVSVLLTQQEAALESKSILIRLLMTLQ